MEKFKIDTERLARVSTQIGAGSGDISDLLMPDLKHLCEVLGRVHILQELAPGFLDEMFDIFIPHFIKMQNKAIVGQEAQNRANAAGFGAEWKAVIDAGNSPNQKNYMQGLVEFHMKLNGVNQAQAVEAIAKQANKDPDNLRRTVNRSKSRQSNQ